MTEPVPIPDSPMSPATHERLEAVRRALLRLHKALLDGERIRYEQVYGRIASGGELLQLVIRDPWFAWLRPISEIIVQVDEIQDAKEPVSEAQAQTLLGQVRALLTPTPEGEGFGRSYYDALQKDPNSILMHGEISRLLPAAVASEG